MKKLREYLIKWTDGQKVRGINVTPYDVEECIRVYNAIVRKEKPEFINGKVKEILDKCKIKTVTEGIGWRIKKKKNAKIVNTSFMIIRQELLSVVSMIT